MSPSMKKEILISIVVGLIFGLIITYGIYTASTALRNKELSSSSDVLNESSPSPETAEDTNLVIHNPEDESVQDTEEVRVAGTTIASSFVVIFINDQETIITADESGNFSIESELETGSNIISIFALDEDGNTLSKELTVIYSTVSLEDDESETSES